MQLQSCEARHLNLSSIADHSAKLPLEVCKVCLPAEHELSVCIYAISGALYKLVPGYPSLSATATVVVEVADANDNAPVFDHATYDARVVENRPPGTVVFQPWAADKDIGRNAEIRLQSAKNLTSCCVRI